MRFQDKYTTDQLKGKHRKYMDILKKTHIKEKHIKKIYLGADISEIMILEI